MSGSPAKFLLVDDNEPNLLALRSLLRRDDVDMLEARSGREALELLLRHDIALAFIDVQMPIMDGFELAELMRGSQRSRHIPIIFLTAGPQDNLRRFHGYTAGAVDFLYKPIEPHVLQSKATIFLELYRQREELARQRDHLAHEAEHRARLLREREEADRRLRESEQRFRILADSAPVPIWMHGLEGCEFGNRAYLDFFGVTKQEDVEKFNWTRYLHEDDREAYVAGYRQAVEQRVPFEASARFRRHDGVYRSIRSVGIPNGSTGGPFTGYVGASFDMTDSQEAEERLQRWSHDLERAVNEKTVELTQSQERLRALATELNLTEQRERQRLAGELHDHLAQMLVLGKLKLSQTGPRHNFSAAGLALVKEVEEVLTQALAYTRTLVAELAPPVLHEFGLLAALPWLAEQMKRYGLTVTVEVPQQEGLHLPSDRLVLVFQSVKELLLNAAKHANSGRATVVLERRGGDLCIEVRDAGDGFDPSTLGAAIQSGSTPGFGLLSIRERMLAIGGRLDLVSSPGHGTSATLTMPLTCPPKPDAAAILSAPSAAAAELGSRASVGQAHEPAPDGLASSRSHIRLLLADDHAMVRQGLRGALQNYADIQVVGEAGNGLEAIRMTKQTLPDVILMDVNMPKMDGITATRHIKSAFPTVSIIGLSVQNEAHVSHAMKAAGAVTFLSKDSAIEDLYQAIQDVRDSSGLAENR
jgi:PAS domain S-box-containing protein